MLDTLPYDILRYKIYPYLDYTDRLSLNPCLKLINIYKKVKHDEILRLGLKLAIDKIKKGLNTVMNLSYNSMERYTALLHFIQDILPNNLVLTQYSMKFRIATIDKIAQLLDPTYDDYSRFEEGCREKMQKASLELSILMETKYPYKYDICLNPPNSLIGLFPLSISASKFRGKLIMDISDGRHIIILKKKKTSHHSV
jgi:hypothetical protein